MKEKILEIDMTNINKSLKEVIKKYGINKIQELFDDCKNKLIKEKKEEIKEEIKRYIRNKKNYKNVKMMKNKNPKEIIYAWYTIWEKLFTLDEELMQKVTEKLNVDRIRCYMGVPDL